MFQICHDVLFGGRLLLGFARLAIRVAYFLTAFFLAAFFFGGAAVAGSGQSG